MEESFDTEVVMTGTSASKTKTWLYFWFAVVGGIAVCSLWSAWLITAPANFPLNESVNIEKGWSAAKIANAVNDAGAVRSSTVLYMILVLLHDPSDIKAGAYVFTEPLNVFGVASRLAEDIPQATLVTLTFPEGYSVKTYSYLAAAKLNNFDELYFYEQAQGYEGYLFPDTYFVPADFSADDLINLLRESYKAKTSELRPQIDSSDLAEDELVTLASIVEREANTSESMKIVAGILLKRLQSGMPLQVDASMEYILDKPLKELKADDLKIDSPYNTYLYKGLTPTPIGNPGLTAIRAVLAPEDTPYWFYITDDSGEFHYGRTLAEHNRNIDRYLK